MLQWASYQIRKSAGCACAGNAGSVFPRHWFQRKLLVSDPGMHRGTCVTHVPWCMSGSLTRGGGENVPGIPGACATRNFAYLARGPFIGILVISCKYHGIYASPGLHNGTIHFNVDTCQHEDVRYPPPCLTLRSNLIIAWQACLHYMRYNMRTNRLGFGLLWL